MKIRIKKGWFFKIKPAVAGELEKLMSPTDYDKHIKEGAH